MQNTKTARISVYVGTTGNTRPTDRVSFAARQAQIDGVKNPRVKVEKIRVFELLETALAARGLTPESAGLSLTESGRWISPVLALSLSHGGGVACAALSDQDVGVDIEAEEDVTRRMERLSAGCASLGEKILTEKERAQFAAPDAKALAVLWTKKESIYKTLGEGIFRPEKTETTSADVRTVRAEVGGIPILISLAGNGADSAVFFDVASDGSVRPLTVSDI